MRDNAKEARDCARMRGHCRVTKLRLLMGGQWSRLLNRLWHGSFGHTSGHIKVESKLAS